MTEREQDTSQASHSDGEAEFVPRIDRVCLIRADEFISRLLYFDEPATRRRLVKDALVLWQPDSVPKRFYYPIFKLSERRVSAWPPGLFLQLQILQMTEVEQIAQEEEHLSQKRILPEAVFVERFIQKLVIASMAIPSDGGSKLAGKRQRREARNIFSLCVALCQVLRNYVSAQAGVIYQAATQATRPADDRSDNAHSAIKLKIMKALLDRFGEFIREEQTTRGEWQFVRQASQRQVQWQPVVRETLSYLLPWGSQHILKEKTYRPGETMLELTVARGSKKGSWQILANCAHVLICTDCFINLIANLHPLLGRPEEPLPRPDDVLAIPVFYEQSSDDPPHRPATARGREKLEDYELLEEIHKERDRAQKKRGMRLAVVVDNDPPFEHDLIRDGAEIEFDLPRKATYLRIYSRDEDGDLLLAGASIRRAWYDGEIIRERLVGLGGQTVELLVTPHSNERSALAGARIHLKYHEAFLRKRLLSGWERTWHRWTSAYTIRPYHVAAGVGLFMAALLAAILLPLRPQSPEQSVIVPDTSKSPEMSLATPTPTPEGRIVVEQPTNRSRRSTNQPDKNPIAPEIAQRLPSRNADPLEPYDRGTRTLSAAESRKQLREVKKLFVRVEGPEDLANRVRPAAEAVLPATVEILTAGNESAADAHLIIRIASDGQTASATARLVNRDGRVLWPLKPRPPIKKNTAVVEDIGEEVGNALSDEIARAAAAGVP